MNHSRRFFLLSALGLLSGCATLSAAERAAVTGSASDPPKTGGKTGKKMNPKEPAPVSVPEGKQIATIAGGCFWCVEAIFLQLKGVEKVTSGYSGGEVVNPTYEAVCTGRTGHAEAIQIIFDPKIISYRDLLRIFFTTHDPTTPNQQGADRGTQYRSAVFYHNAEQKKIAEEVIKEIDAEEIYPSRVVTEVTAYANFYPAEEYHQDYYARNSNQGYCRVVIAPKVLKFRAKYQKYLKP